MSYYNQAIDKNIIIVEQEIHYMKQRVDLFMDYAILRRFIQFQSLQCIPFIMCRCTLMWLNNILILPHINTMKNVIHCVYVIVKSTFYRFLK